jgi:hypothetical protein
VAQVAERFRRHDNWSVRMAGYVVENALADKGLLDAE